MRTRQAQRATTGKDSDSLELLLRALNASDDDAAVVARVALAVFLDSIAIVDGEPLRADTPGMTRRMKEARAALTNAKRATDGRRIRVIEAVEFVRALESSKEDIRRHRRARVLAVALGVIDPRFTVFFDAQKAQFWVKLERELGLQRPSSTTLAATLAERAGVERSERNGSKAIVQRFRDAARFWE